MAPRSGHARIAIDEPHEGDPTLATYSSIWAARIGA
jgi:hypothetical protein